MLRITLFHLMKGLLFVSEGWLITSGAKRCLALAVVAWVLGVGENPMLSSFFGIE
jgi:hypothetical protein